MEYIHLLGAAAGPLFAMLVFGVFAQAVKLYIARNMPDCWLKKQLLSERIKTQYSAANRCILEQAARYTREHS